MADSKHFKVIIGTGGAASVRALPGIDTGEHVMFNKVELEQELTQLFEQAFASGASAGQSRLQEILQKHLGLRP